MYMRLLLSIYALYKYIESLSIVICIFLCNLYILGIYITLNVIS